MIIIFILLLILFGCVKPEIFAAAVGICFVIGAALIALSATGLTVEWQEVTRWYPLISFK